MAKNNLSNEKASKLFLVGVIALLLLIGATIGWQNYRKKVSQTNKNTSFEPGKPYTDPNPQNYAAKGKVTTGFPNELLEGSTDITSSYSRASGSSSLLSAQFNLNKTEKEAYDLYTKYLNDHKYTITSQGYAQKAGAGTISNLYGKAANGDQLNIIIMQSKADVGAKPVAVSIVYNPHK